MKFLSAFLFFLILQSVSIGQTSNTKTGVWSDPSIWTNNVLPPDTADIKLNFDITIDINVSCRSFNANGHKVTVNSGVSMNVSGTNAFVFDTEGHLYYTVGIGDQFWMKENLRVTRYRNGDTIPQVQNQTAWSALKTGAWCYYNNDSSYDKVYGKLYNWYAVNDPRGLAPVGWHVPIDTDWVILTSFLGGESMAGGPMKETGLVHWLSPNGGASNSSGFTALPGGWRSGGSFSYPRELGAWWSSSEASQFPYATSRMVNSTNSGVSRFDFEKTTGLYVRCLSNKGYQQIRTSPVTNITYNSAISGGLITENGNLPILSKGVCWSKNAAPKVTDNNTNDGSGDSAFVSKLTGLANNTTYYVRAYIISGIDTVYGNQVSFKTDKIIKIGYQSWMPKNLNVSTYRNGDTIPHITDPAQWAAATTGAWCDYQNSEYGDSVYGKLYNWYAVNDPRGLGPAGWHVPSDSEWTKLVNWIGSSTAGNDLKESGTTNWQYPNGVIGSGVMILANNYWGFTALPGGYRNENGSFQAVSTGGFWWSTTPTVSGQAAYTISMSYTTATVYSSANYKSNGLSVRLVNDNFLPEVNNVNYSLLTNTSVTSGGNVTISGPSPVIARGVCWTKTGSPGPTLNDAHTVDGSGLGAFVSNVTGLEPNTNYSLRAYATNAAGTVYNPSIIVFKTLP